MNRSFENIFEKFNVRNETPRKRHTRAKPLLYRKSLPTATRIEAANSNSYSAPNSSSSNFSTSFYLNNNSRAKYNVPTRYSRIEMLTVPSEAKLQTYSPAERITFNNKGRSKENGKEKKQTVDQRQICDKAAPSKATLCSTENKNNTQLYSGTVCSKVDKLLNKTNVNGVPEINKTNLIIDNSFTKSSGSENTDDITLQSTHDGSAELDLLLNLIEQEEQISERMQTGKISNDDERLLVTKPILKGGYQEMFEHCLKDAKAKSNFLKYDKKLGLRIGRLLTVLKMETFYGLNLATVQSQDSNKKFAVAVASKMALHLKVGSRIEAFFDDNTLPYKLLLNGEHFDVYLEPYKLITH